MIAPDTDVLVRYLVADDATQADRAERVLRSGPVLVPKTVLLETDWVLRSAYNFKRPAIAAAFVQLLGLPTVESEDAPVLARALGWYGDGLDFADALHLASSRGADGFVTFDAALRHTAARLSGLIPVIAP